MERYRILPITECYGGMEHRLYPVVLFGPEDAVLVDCGYPGCSAALEEALTQAGVRPEQLTKLLLTHQDDDHMGAAFELVQRYPRLQVAASQTERPFLSGEKRICAWSRRNSSRSTFRRSRRPSASSSASGSGRSGR